MDQKPYKVPTGTHMVHSLTHTTPKKAYLIQALTPYRKIDPSEIKYMPSHSTTSSAEKETSEVSYLYP